MYPGFKGKNDELKMTFKIFIFEISGKNRKNSVKFRIILFCCSAWKLTCWNIIDWKTLSKNTFFSFFLDLKMHFPKDCFWTSGTAGANFTNILRFYASRLMLNLLAYSAGRTADKLREFSAWAKWRSWA